MLDFFKIFSPPVFVKRYIAKIRTGVVERQNSVLTYTQFSYKQNNRKVYIYIYIYKFILAVN